MSLVKNKWWMLFVTTSGTSLVMLDNTIMPVALPSIEREMHLDAVGLIWIVNAYLLSLTALLLIGGRLSDLFGKRALFIWGLFLFGVGSLLAAYSQTVAALILGRIVQGAGGALTIPSTGALLISSFGIGERAKAIGINSGISSIFLILGPAIGGFLTEYIGWRSIFFVNIPIVIFGIAMAFAILKREERSYERFHISGALIMLVGLVSLVIGLMEGNDWGWRSPLTISLIVAGLILLLFFIWISNHAHHPIINFKLFHNRLFTVANISLFFAQIIMMVTVLWAIYFQLHLNYSPVQTGMLIFIVAFPVFIMAPLAGYLADHFTPRYPLLLGFSITILGLLWLLFTAGTKKLIMLLPGLIGYGCGLPLIMTPTFALALSQSLPQELGSAAGITTATRQLASTTGIALLTAIYEGTLRRGSSAAAFSAISWVATFFALVGLVMIHFMVKKEDHLERVRHAKSDH